MSLGFASLWRKFDSVTLLQRMDVVRAVCAHCGLVETMVASREEVRRAGLICKDGYCAGTIVGL